MRSAPAAACRSTSARDSAVSPLRATLVHTAPCSVTSPASSRELESGIVPGSSAWPASRSSAPVDTTATRTCGRTSTEPSPTEARAEMAAADSLVPAAMTESPAATSSPARRTLRPRVAAARISTRSGIGCGPGAWSVSSTLTTASAPSGSIAPVMIRWAVPSARGRGAAPAGTSPLTGRTTGVSGQAPVVSFARTA